MPMEWWLFVVFPIEYQILCYGLLLPLQFADYKNYI